MLLINSSVVALLLSITGGEPNTVSTALWAIPLPVPNAKPCPIVDIKLPNMDGVEDPTRESVGRGGGAGGTGGARGVLSTD